MKAELKNVEAINASNSITLYNELSRKNFAESRFMSILTLLRMQFMLSTRQVRQVLKSNNLIWIWDLCRKTRNTIVNFYWIFLVAKTVYLIEVVIAQAEEYLKIIKRKQVYV